MNTQTQKFKLSPMTMIFVALLLVFNGCASSKPVSGMEQVEQNRKLLSENADKLKQANKELASMQDRLGDLKKDFNESKDLPSKVEAVKALNHLSLSLQESRMSINDLVAKNDEARRSLDTRLQKAAEATREQLEESSR